MLDRLEPNVAMSFVRQSHVADGCAVAFQRLIHALALNWECAGVVVGLAMDQQDRILDLVGEGERRDLHVHLRRLPESAALTLEAEGRERAVVSATAGNAGAEQI